METAHNDQELESASVTLVDGLHFAGDIGGVHIDLDAEERVGGVGAGPQPYRLLPAGERNRIERSPEGVAAPAWKPPVP